MLGEVQQSPVKTCIFHFPVSVLLLYKTKEDNITSTTENMMLIAVSYQFILILGEYVLLGGSKRGDEVLDDYGVEN